MLFRSIDIIEHLEDPSAFLAEVHRLLKPGGAALITIPVMHDHYVHVARGVKNLITGKKTRVLPEGHPDRHNTELSRRSWMKVFAASPLVLTRVRATTLFPPLHLYGVPKFWFTCWPVHVLDRFLCSVPLLRRLGQSWMCVLKKPE